MNYKKIGIWLLIMVLVLLTILVINEKTIVFDTNVYRIIMALKSSLFTAFMKFITAFGGFYFISFITLCICLYRYRKFGAWIFLNSACCSILSVLLKLIFMRPRPTEALLIDVTGYSYPSAHAMMAMAFYGLLIYYAYHLIRNQTIKITLITLMSILILLVGVSRVYLGVHYATDVIGGFLFSFLYLFLFIPFTKKVSYFYR